ncbi:MAG TPA: CU044_2847 family protein [Anaerolineales bacterium]|nr:CU044_2847 family protein [Anaerolineales bacterium]
MSTYIGYTMEDGSVLLVESEEGSGDIVKASRQDGVDVVTTGKTFTAALASVRGSLQALVTELDALKVGEAEVKFGLKAIGEAGIIAVGKVGGEVNYEVTLRWKKPEEKPKARPENEHV